MTIAIPTTDGPTLHGWLRPGRDARAVLVIAHGVGEHSGCYDHVARDLAGRAGLVDVLGFDFRGHGRSPGRRGVVRRYEDLVADLRAALDWAGRERPGVARFVLGHSNGGQVALRAALQDPGAIAGLILSNPTIAVGADVPAWKVALGRLLRVFAPWVTLPAGLGAEQMTSDPENLRARAGDPLRHDRISAPLYFGMVEGGARLVAAAPRLEVPVLLLLGEADPVVDPLATRDFFGRLGSADKTLRVFAGMRHEPLNERGRERVVEAVAGWLAGRIPADARAGVDRAGIA